MAVKLASDLYKATNLTLNLYGADVLVTYDLIQELLKYETKVFGLNLTHSQDKDYINVSNDELFQLIIIKFRNILSFKFSKCFMRI